MDADELTWEPPGPGVWFPSPEHMPTPVSGLMAKLLPETGRGWRLASDRYGLPPATGTFGIVNCWGYYSPGVPPPADLDELERVAAETLATQRWRGNLRRWRDEVRPAVLGETRALLTTDLGALSDQELASHVRAAIDGFLRHGPEHFAAMNDGTAAVGAFLQATKRWGLDARRVVLALSGASTASSSAERLLERIAAGLRDAGVAEPTDLDTIGGVGGDAAGALEELLTDYGWRPFDADVAQPTLAERPDAVVAAVRAALAGWSVRTRPDDQGLEALRAEVPEGERARFDELLADARAGYGNNDDNTVVLFSLPLGAVRRAALEVGRRAVARGGAQAVDDVLDATPAELVELARGAGPSADDLAARHAFRLAMADVTPPPMLGRPPPPPPPVELPPSVRALDALLDEFRAVAWAGSDAGRAAATVGTEVVRGRAVVVTDPLDAAVRLQPGDVLVALTTSAPFNTVFPLAAAVAVQTGSLMSHAAVLARELGLTALVGVPDLLTRVADGDLVEVDPDAGTIRVVG